MCQMCVDMINEMNNSLDGMVESSPRTNLRNLQGVRLYRECCLPYVANCEIGIKWIKRLVEPEPIEGRTNYD